MNNKSSKNKTDKMFQELNKIWPAKSAIPILITFFLIGLIIIIGSLLLDKRRKKNDYYSFKINGKVDKCVESRNYRFYKINGAWYGVQGMINTHIRENDSLIKTKKCYDIVVISSNRNKEIYHYPFTFFKSIDENKKLNNYFRVNVDTLDASKYCDCNKDKKHIIKPEPK